MKRKNSFKALIPILVLSSISMACAFSFDLGGASGTPSPQIEAIPAATLTASIEPAVTATTEQTENATQTPGSIRGNLSYPSEFIPPLRVVAFRVEDGIWSQYYTYVTTNLNASEYQIDGLQPGFYWITAYTIPTGDGAPAGLAGGYSQAVLCGLSVDCTDHSLVIVEVKSGQVTGGADPADWYAAEGSFLPNPAP
jgi:hypothetical protein